MANSFAAFVSDYFQMLPELVIQIQYLFTCGAYETTMPTIRNRDKAISEGLCGCQQSISLQMLMSDK